VTCGGRSFCHFLVFFSRRFLHFFLGENSIFLNFLTFFFDTFFVTVLARPCKNVPDALRGLVGFCFCYCFRPKKMPLWRHFFYHSCENSNQTSQMILGGYCFFQKIAFSGLGEKQYPPIPSLLHFLQTFCLFSSFPGRKCLALNHQIFVTLQA